MTIKNFRVVVNKDDIAIQWLHPEDNIWMTECTYHLTKASFGPNGKGKPVRAVYAELLERMAQINNIWLPHWSFEVNYTEEQE